MRAAGSADKLPKQFLDLAGKPVVVWALAVFDRSPLVDTVILAVAPGWVDYAHGFSAEYAFKKPLTVVAGGTSRQESVHNGLKAASPQTSVVVVHDGCRPCLTTAELDDTIGCLDDYAGVCIGVPVNDTLKTVRGGFVRGTVDRAGIWRVQTPQVFEFGQLLAAHEQAVKEGFAGTDDCSLVERAGGRILMTPGSVENIKVTVESDLLFAEAILAARGKRS